MCFWLWNPNCSRKNNNDTNWMYFYLFKCMCCFQQRNIDSPEHNNIMPVSFFPVLSQFIFREYPLSSRSWSATLKFNSELLWSFCYICYDGVLALNKLWPFYNGRFTKLFTLNFSHKRSTVDYFPIVTACADTHCFQV